ncbi:hypothetical protein BD311DRAFT_769810 [Dichomitus squalens]|uniref:Uncharacterized protein n=1 Tax=Dichomitus squalens TaxID=114155 RepID=A0A4Q9M9W0_9APHY|nr:hypothetical protein BD311DRAFT_769810 [Dichomitus squalens]
MLYTESLYFIVIGSFYIIDLMLVFLRRNQSTLNLESGNVSPFGDVYVPCFLLSASPLSR